MIKTHRKTGLKYLCYTRKTGKAFDEYIGSGTRWRNHLKEHGNDITTEIIFQTINKDEFANKARDISKELGVINDPEHWANLKLEEGDGGDTVSNRMWVTNGTEDKYVFKKDGVPDGWRKGRSKCVFNDRKNQQKFGRMVDLKARGTAIKKAWDEGRVHRDHSKCGKKGDENVACRPEVKEKIRAAALLDSKVRSKRLKKLWKDHPEKMVHKNG